MNVFVMPDAQNQTCLSYAMARKRLIYQNNIAEGFEYGSDAKLLDFLNISRGSCAEVCSIYVKIQVFEQKRNDISFRFNLAILPKEE